MDTGQLLTDVVGGAFDARAATGVRCGGKLRQLASRVSHVCCHLGEQRADDALLGHARRFDTPGGFEDVHDVDVSP